jgi:hypothetical protein
MGASNSLPQSETINWKNIKTDQVSSTIPNLNGISVEANKLVEKLNLPEISDSSSELNDIFLTKINKSNSVNNNLSENNFSSTSPFISSEMYNYVMDKYKNQNMVGGAHEKNSLEDDSETTSTSSSDSKSSDSDKSTPVKKESKSNKQAKGNSNKQVKGNNNKQVKGNNNKQAKVDKRKISKKGTEDFMDYMSSSAHTGGSITDNSSIENENNLSISSVRTSQLNLVSE